MVDQVLTSNQKLQVLSQRCQYFTQQRFFPPAKTRFDVEAEVFYDYLEGRITKQEMQTAFIVFANLMASGKWKVGMKKWGMI